MRVLSARLAALLLVCSAHVTHADERATLDELLDPIVTLRMQGALADPQYEKQVLAALKGRKVKPLWRLGFALAKQPVATRAVRVRTEEGVTLMLPPLVWSQTRAIVGVPLECSYGCCGFEAPAQPIGGSYVSKACFAGGELTDLDLRVVVPPEPENGPRAIGSDEAIGRWLAHSDRTAFATALAVEPPVANVAAIRAATTRPTEISAWRAVTAFAAKPARTAQPFVVTLHGREPKPTPIRVASWNALVSEVHVPFAIGTPYICIGGCCLFSQVPERDAPALRDACFDERGHLQRVNLDVSGDRATLVEWIMRRVSEDAKASSWTPATRVDACLAAALDPSHLPALFYCAQRSTYSKARQRELWAYLDERIRESFRHLDDQFDYESYWLGRANGARDRTLRRAALTPLATIAKEGAVLWQDSRRLGIVRTGAEVKRRYRVEPKADSAGGSRFYDVPSVLPSHCASSCCTYRLTTSTPCSVGGGPDNFILYQACFDANGATTDLFVTMESEADPIDHPDEP